MSRMGKKKCLDDGSIKENAITDKGKVKVRVAINSEYTT